MNKEMKEKSEEVANLLKTLGHPKRLLILCSLVDEEKTVGELENICGAAQSQVSQFVKRMQSEGFLNSRKEANFVYYSIKDRRVSSLILEISKIFC